MYSLGVFWKCSRHSWCHYVKLSLPLESPCLFCKDLFLYDVENVTTLIPSECLFDRGMQVKFNTMVVPISQLGILKPISFFSSVLG